jgi:hypothetical protein
LPFVDRNSSTFGSDGCDHPFNTERWPRTGAFLNVNSCSLDNGDDCVESFQSSEPHCPRQPEQKTGMQRPQELTDEIVLPSEARFAVNRLHLVKSGLIEIL